MGVYPECDGGEELTPFTQAKGKKSRLKGILLWGGLALAVLVLTVAAIVLITASDRSSFRYGLYIKDQELFCLDLSKRSVGQVTAGLVGNESNTGNYNLTVWASSSETAPVLSGNGRYIFYLDRVGSKGATLYCKDASSKKGAVKIDTVSSSVYYASDTADLVTYVKNGDLYQYNMKKGESQKIASDITWYNVSADGKSILYSDKENTFFWASSRGETEEIDRKIKQLLLISEDLKTVYYLKASVRQGNSLYKKTAGEDALLIASDLDTVVRAYPSGEFYYLRATTYATSTLYYFDGSKEIKVCEDLLNISYEAAAGAPVIVFCV